MAFDWTFLILISLANIDFCIENMLFYVAKHI
jgi:hypothetical protein